MTVLAASRSKQPTPKRRRLFLRIVIVFLVIVLAWIASVGFRVWSVARVDESGRTDAIVVLGASQYDGRPTPVFAGRLDHVVKLYEEGVAPAVITVGGKLPGDRFTEAEAARMYLIDAGIPDSAIVPVPVGNDTWGSLIGVEKEASSRGWDKVTLVSDPWHMFRAREMAEDLGLTAKTSPTRTGPIVQERITEVRSIVRETAAYVWWRFSGGAPWSGPDIE